ncbi:MAG: PRC-barrel domain-containing protein [Myxococcales bacterium]|nr:PRC-barrel domain-containing protein [Myxococcales bacterium]MCB9734951.1 PRC-barrel domain-containing protein [Deltaproteobacteria bacterium]
MNAKPNMLLSASTLTGDKVLDGKGEKIGKIDELMVDLNRGTIAYAVVSVGGFLGLGDKLFAVPFSAFTIDTDKHAAVLPSATKEVFEKAKGFDKDHWPQINDPEWGKHVHDVWGARPYWS